MEFPKFRRGGACRGSGVARRTEPTVRIRLLKSEHERWSGLKQRRGLSTDNDVARYLLDLADVADVNVAPGSVALSSSIVPGVAMSGALFTRPLLHNCVHTCTYRMRNIPHRRMQRPLPAEVSAAADSLHELSLSGLPTCPEFPSIYLTLYYTHAVTITPCVGGRLVAPLNYALPSILGVLSVSSYVRSIVCSNCMHSSFTQLFMVE